MSRKKRSAGAVFVSFLSGLVSLILILVLAVSVTLNIAFYTKDKPVDVDINLPFYKNHFIYFINNSGDLQEIEKGSLVTIKPDISPSKSFYVLCTIGNNYKTILAVTDIEPNDNGTLSYTVRGTKPSSTITHTVPQYRVQGVVVNQNQQLGDIIALATDIKGAIVMATAAFLLFILCIASIKRNKNRYEDDLVESEILIEELRKLKKGEEKKKELNEKKPELSLAEEKTAQPAPEKPVQADTKKNENFVSEFEDEMNKKAVAVKNAMNSSAPADPKPAENKTPAPAGKAPVPEKEEKPFDPTDGVPAFQNYETIKKQLEAKKEAEEAHNEFNAQMAQLAEKQQQMAMIRSGEHKEPAPSAPVPAAEQKPAPAPAKPEAAAPVHSFTAKPAVKNDPVKQETPAAADPVPQKTAAEAEKPQWKEPAKEEQPVAEQPVKKKKRAVASIKADSFDDLIKMLDNEKKKLD